MKDQRARRIEPSAEPPGSRGGGARRPQVRWPLPTPRASAEAGGGQVWFPASPAFLRLPVSAPYLWKKTSLKPKGKMPETLLQR